MAQSCDTAPGPKPTGDRVGDIAEGVRGGPTVCKLWTCCTVAKFTSAPVSANIKRTTLICLKTDQGKAHIYICNCKILTTASATLNLHAKTIDVEMYMALEKMKSTHH